MLLKLQSCHEQLLSESKDSIFELLAPTLQFKQRIGKRLGGNPGFKEKMPELHLIAAGSLLEFVLDEERFSFPVGRVQFLYLHPLSFEEFMLAQEEQKLLELLDNTDLSNPLPSDLHDYLNKQVKKYTILGGMPEAIDTYLVKRSYFSAYTSQINILKTYRFDFSKYASKADFKHLEKLFSRAPDLVGSHFKYVNVDRDVKPETLKMALTKLVQAGVVNRIHATGASGLPLRSQVNEKKFKVLFLDIGLMRTGMGLEPQEVFEDDLINLRSGVLAEQFVGQELLSYSNLYKEKQLYFWEREKKPSSAEIDYVFNLESKIIPIEVKAGKTGKLRSLQQFMLEKESPVGVRISSLPLSFERNILSVPFYMIKHLSRLLKQVRAAKC
ncbi:Uncharacterized protein SCG7109_BI_00010 [Chlamydiales bacterium SCGC AG-110-M15]|nr:Uncharacterized protein SCG7109_BI_00010 [Chlamydiales bacterium SCGC AG-110-M15]